MHFVIFVGQQKTTLSSELLLKTLMQTTLFNTTKNDFVYIISVCLWDYLGKNETYNLCSMKFVVV